jgi:hypothetical protein
MTAARVIGGVARTLPRFEPPADLIDKLERAIGKSLTPAERETVTKALVAHVTARRFILASPRANKKMRECLEGPHAQAVEMLAVLDWLRKDDHTFGLVYNGYRVY